MCNVHESAVPFIYEFFLAFKILVLKCKTKFLTLFVLLFCLDAVDFYHTFKSVGIFLASQSTSLHGKLCRQMKTFFNMSNIEEVELALAEYVTFKFLGLSSNY